MISSPTEVWSTIIKSMDKFSSRKKNKKSEFQDLHNLFGCLMIDLCETIQHLSPTSINGKPHSPNEEINVSKPTIQGDEQRQ